ncbi:MAG: AAA family ATPase [Acidobacteriota bacterium]
MTGDNLYQPTERDYTLGFYIEYPALRDAVEIPAGFFSASAEQRAVWAVIDELRAAGDPIQPVTILEKCHENGNLGYLSAITSGLGPMKPEEFRRRIFRQRSGDARKRQQSLSAAQLPDWDEVDAVAEEARRLELDAEGERSDPGPVLMTGAELQALDIKVEEVVSGGLVYEQSLGFWYGATGTGKTWLGLQIAEGVESGRSVLGLRTKQRPVVYVDYENPLPVLAERVRCLKIQGVQFWTLSAKMPPPKLDSPEWELFKRLPTGSLMIFDTSRSSHYLDANLGETAALIMGRLKELRDIGHEIILLHHTTKADDQNATGSQNWYDLADHTISLCRVRRGTLEEVDDGGAYDSGALLSLGVGKKTRFAPSPRIYLTLDPNAGGLVLADSPDAEAISTLAEYIAGEGCGKNQTDIIQWASDEGIGSKHRASLAGILRRGEGIRWRVHKGRYGAKIYEPIS